MHKQYVGTCNTAARVDDVFFILMNAMVMMTVAIIVTKFIVPIKDVGFYS